MDGQQLLAGRPTAEDLSTCKKRYSISVPLAKPTQRAKWANEYVGRNASPRSTLDCCRRGKSLKGAPLGGRDSGDALNNAHTDAKLACNAFLADLAAR